MKIVDSDAFLDMPLSTQCLYFHLNMRADDDGFIGNPKRIMKVVGASDDDLKLLIAKRFLLTFEDGVIVIKHWRMHNTLSKNRYQQTHYLDEKSMLKLKENGSYTLSDGIDIDDTKLIEKSRRQEKDATLANKRRNIGEQKTDSDIDLDKDIDKGIDINNPPISPLGGTGKEQKKETYKELFERLLLKYNISDYLLESVKDWIEYKIERNRFKYKEKGLNTLLRQISDSAKRNGDETVANAISESIASGYQGIVWDKVSKKNQNRRIGSIDWDNV